MAYKLTHPDSEQEIERKAEDVPTYLTQGWVTKPGASLPTKTTVDRADGKSGTAPRTTTTKKESTNGS